MALRVGEWGKNMIWALATFVLIGTVMAMQSPVNAALARELGGPVRSVLTAFMIGFAVLAVVALLQGGTLPPLDLPPVPGWGLAIACLAAWYVLAAIWGVSTMGILTLTSALVLGQLAASVVIDATGALGAEVREVTPERVTTACLMLAGLILSRA
jgi:bacterial/archaeal transporter family-2 protein